MKPGDRVQFFEWDDSLRIAKLDPNAKHGKGVILDVLYHYAGYCVRIQTDDGRILDLHEVIHSIEVIHSDMV